MSGTGVKNRFAELRLPKFAPGLWVWSFIGGAYYVLFFFLLKSILARPPVRLWTWVALTVIAVMLIANASWNWIFFRKKNLWLSFAFFVPYILLSLVLAGVLHHIRNPISGWYAVYLAYVLYATWWGYRVWRLNSGSPHNT
jgi:tryptophan-rich sensory protein